MNMSHSLTNDSISFWTFRSVFFPPALSVNNLSAFFSCKSALSQNIERTPYAPVIGLYRVLYFLRNDMFNQKIACEEKYDYLCLTTVEKVTITDNQKMMFRFFDGRKNPIEGYIKTAGFKASDFLPFFHFIFE